MPSYEEKLALLKLKLKKSKRELAKLPAAVKKEYVAKKRAEEFERVLLPDAPPRKHPRIGVSPPRSACRLVPGTPTVPPPPKPQQRWQQRRKPSATVTSEDVGLTLSPPGSSPSVPPPSTRLPPPSPRLPPPSPRLPPPSPRLPPPSPRLPAPSPRLPPPSPRLPPPSPRLPPPSTRLPPPSTRLPRTDLQPLPSCSLPSPTSQALSIHVKCEDPDTEQDEAMDQEWLDRLSDEEEEIGIPKFETDFESISDPLDLQNPAIDYAGKEPASLPEETDATLRQWLTDQDFNADRTVREKLSDDSLTFDWSNDPDSFLGQREDFTGDSGPTFPILDSTRPIDVFLRFFDDEIFNLIVSETNRYGAASIMQPLEKHSRLRQFKETDKNEVAVFIAVLIFQGVLPLTVEKDYFRENGYLTLPYFKSLMTYNRFMILKRLLNFSDDAASTQNMTIDQQKLRKLGPLLDLLNNKFSTLYLPSRNIAIDESLLKWHGCLSFTQKISTKAPKVGVKSYELCEASTGYLWKFMVYTGKGMTHGQTDETQQTDRTDRDDGQVPPNITAKIVDDLVKPLLNRGHTLTMDNFHNSPLLARYLKTNKTDCLGTLRVNRDFVPESIKSLAKSELRKGEIVHSYCRDLNILLWRDNNIISMISTFHKGFTKEKHDSYRYKPQAVLDYNVTMGGVDKKDQLLSSHPMERTRNQAWYNKVFRRLLNVTVLNAYIIFKTRFPKITYREFRIQLANELVKTFKRPAVEVPRLTNVEITSIIQARTFQRPILKGNHFIGLGASKHKRCVWCKSARSIYICKQCNVSLCLQMCFEHFHTQV